jgi:hypothetical protein
VTRGRAILLLLAGALPACPSDPSEPDAGPSEDSAVPVETCSTPCPVYTYAPPDDSLVRLEPMDTLRVGLPFQALFIARTSVRTLEALRTEVPVSTFMEVEGLEIISAHQRVLSSSPVPDDAGYQSSQILIFFNDATLAELDGKQARLRLRSTTTTCVCDSDVTVMLAQGDTGALPPDAGVGE